ncbi:hypothetical protein TcCL_ESM09360 [Trypanosoma cruzi]|nr:hypothetical protein TcCL_ESM09360 [Trypanosoma cruzi]
MSRDNSSQPLKYAARHSVNRLTVLAVVWCPPAVVIRSPTSVFRRDSKKKKPSTSGKFSTSVTYSTPHSTSILSETCSSGGKTWCLVERSCEYTASAQRWD